MVGGLRSTTVNDLELDALVDSLSLDEQISLLAGSDNWHTVAIPSKAIPSMRVTDGPAGARGTSFTGPASVNLPCGTALAASWDPALVQEIGALLGRETRSKGARVVLAPTVNLHRTPIGGRNFECYSEDPFLSARTAVGYVKGVQSEGVAACVKHYVGNDTEFERLTIDSQIDERTLRELYLVPFEAAVTEAGALAIMTAYNRINGPYAADHTELITTILRGEWGFDGIVMSDWFGLHSTTEGVNAGLDLEMPGPTKHRGAKLRSAVDNGLVSALTIRETARRMVRFMDTIGVITDGGPGLEVTRDEPEDRALVRAAGAAGMVLLRNESVALPLAATGLQRVAVIGPNALQGQIMGGGSALVNPVHAVHPLAALTDRFSALGVDVVHARGSITHKTVPKPESRLLSGVQQLLFATAAQMHRAEPPTLVRDVRGFNFMWSEDPAEGVPFATVALRTIATFTPDVSGEWSFGTSALGHSTLSIDGVVLLDDDGRPAGGSFFGMGKSELVGTMMLEAGRAYELKVEFESAPMATMSGLSIGAMAPLTLDLIQEAASLAATSDLSILVVGTNPEWESEGYDRVTMDLPGTQNQLISEVAAVSRRTVVVVNAGSPVSMPWLDEVDAVVFTWFPGQEFGDALADVLFGDVEPGGRLPVTFPQSLEDTPAFEHHPGRHGVARYLEGRLMGYRWYDSTGRQPLFPFGHGLGYATILIEGAHITNDGVEVQLVNAGSRSGHEVVQVYVHHEQHGPSVAADEPDQKLVGFAKVSVGAQGTAIVTVSLDPRWASHWDTDTHAWTVTPGPRELRVGRSSRDIAVRIATTV